jgi:hypothetical protein
MLKKVLKITLIVIVVLIGAAFAAPFLFKGKIIEIAKKEINNSLTAKVDFSDLNISLFRHFPKVSVALENLQVIGTGNFTRDTLISAKNIDVALNLWSVIKGSNYQINSITVNQPRIHAIVDKDGKANWDIAKPDTATVETATEEKPYKMTLQKYAINGGYIKYEDVPGGMSSEISNLNHEGSGDFTSDLFTLETKTTADAVSFTYGGIPYLSKTKTSIDADIQIDNKTNKYTFKTDEIAVNELKLATEGFFQLVNDSTYNMDIKFNAPAAEFKTILSLVPVVYQKDFASIKTSGQALFDGMVKGTYSSTQIPAYKVNLEIKNGFFQYPDLPKPVKNINVIVHVNNPDGVTDNTVVDIPQGHIEMDNDPFDFRLLLKNPMTSQYIDAAAKGKLDLSKITQFVKLEDGTKLSGLVNADIQAKGSVAAIQKQQPGEFSAKGFADITNLFYSSKAFPQPIQNTSARINVDNPDGVADHTVVQIPSAHVEVGKDVVDATLLLKTPASDPYFEGTAKGSFDLGNIKQFYAFEPGTSLAGLLKADVSFKGKKSFIDKKQYDAVQTAGTVQASNISYKSKDYPDGVNISNSLFTFNPKNVTINNVAGNFMQTNFSANGSFDNLVGYALKDEPLAGTLNISADKLDLNKFMGTDTAATTSTAATSEPFAVPKNIQFTLNANLDKLHYDKVDYNNIKGGLLIKDETVTLKNVQMQALDGTLALSGSYSTKENKKTPDITMAYDVQNLDVQKTFLAFNTVQKLMPVGKFISGKLTSKLTMKGKLGSDMMPDLGSLTGEGSLLLLQGFLSKFGPLEKLASTLNVAELQQISVKDIKNYFEFANGKVLVKPFNFKVKDIEMQVGGMHGLDQSIDYLISMKLPRAMLGTQGNNLIDNLASQATAKGIPVNVGETINLSVKMGGTITNPAIKTDLKGSGGSLAEDLKKQATDFAKAKVDSAKIAVTNAVKDSVASAKKQVVEGLKDQLAKQLGGQKDSSNQTSDPKKKLEETGKGLLNNLFKKKKDTANKN